MVFERVGFRNCRWKETWHDRGPNQLIEAEPTCQADPFVCVGEQPNPNGNGRTMLSSTPHSRLSSMLVSDAMTRQVVEVEVNQSLCEAAVILRDNDLVAAPVVDEQGRCVGMLSASSAVQMGRSCKSRRKSPACPAIGRDGRFVPESNRIAATVRSG